jgi:hypothetical protein
VRPDGPKTAAELRAKKISVSCTLRTA